MAPCKKTKVYIGGGGSQPRVYIGFLCIPYIGFLCIPYVSPLDPSIWACWGRTRGLISRWVLWMPFGTNKNKNNVWSHNLHERGLYVSYRQMWTTILHNSTRSDSRYYRKPHSGIFKAKFTKWKKLHETKAKVESLKSSKFVQMERQCLNFKK